MPWNITNILPDFKRLFSHSTNHQVGGSDPVPGIMESPVVDESRQRPINPQMSSPLFSRIPAEIRNYIFELVLTSFDDETRPYKKGAYYYRPSHRYAQKIDTTLLLTCRRVYAETQAIPASINEHTSWYHRAPPDVLKNGFSMEECPAAVKRRNDLETVHLFTQQFWLEGQLKRFLRRMNATNATRLKITLRHTDWWFWEDEAPLALDPKQSGKPENRLSSPSNQFEPKSWGSQLLHSKGLEEFQLELETVEKKKHELDSIVAKAPEWEFPLSNGKVLVLNQAKTSRTGWVGYQLGFKEDEGDFDVIGGDDDQSEIDWEAEGNVEFPRPPPSDDTPADTKPTTKPQTAKQRLLADGVKFVDEHLEPDDNQCLTYYVVTLTWNPRAITNYDV